MVLPVRFVDWCACGVPCGAGGVCLLGGVVVFPPGFRYVRHADGCLCFQRFNPLFRDPDLRCGPGVCRLLICCRSARRGSSP